MTKQNFEILSSTGGKTGSSESTFVRIPHCWKSHVMAHFSVQFNLLRYKCSLISSTQNESLVMTKTNDISAHKANTQTSLGFCSV